MGPRWPCLAPKYQSKGHLSLSSITGLVLVSVQLRELSLDTTEEPGANLHFKFSSLRAGHFCGPVRLPQHLVDIRQSAHPPVLSMSEHNDMRWHIHKRVSHARGEVWK